MFTFDITWVLPVAPVAVSWSIVINEIFFLLSFRDSLDIWYISKSTYRFQFNQGIETFSKITAQECLDLSTFNSSLTIYSVGVVLMWTCFLDSSYLLKHGKSYTTKGC